MMENKHKTRHLSWQEAVTPTSAMIDVVFLLLIFFVVTQTPIVEETMLNADLPSTPGSKARTFMTIGIDRHSAIPEKDMDIYYVNGRRWNFQDLKTLLMETGKLSPTQTIVLSCGPNAVHQKLVKVLDLCAAAKLSNLNMIDDESVSFIPDTPRR